MRRHVCLLTAVFLMLLASAAHASTPHDLTGTWSCCGSGGASSQTWTITAMDKAAGTFSGSGRGGSFTWPITGTVSGSAFSLTTGPYNELRSYSATFRGTISDDSRTLTGSWQDNGAGRGTFTATRPSAPAPSDPNDPGRAPPTRAPAAAADPGELYVADSSAPGGSAIYRVDARTGAKQLVHQGAPFASIRGLGFGPDGHLYVADLGASAIHELVLATGAVTRLSLGSTLLYRPWDVAFSAFWPQDVIVTDSFLKSVVRVNRASGKVERLVDPVAARGFGLIAPHGIAATPFGDPFVADYDTRKVHRVESLNGRWTATVQKRGFTSPQDLAIGVGLSGGEPFPRFFASDAAGAVWTWLERDPELAPRGSGTPEPLSSGGLVKSPTGLALSNDGRTLYVASVPAIGASGGSIVAIDLVTRRARVLADGFASPIGLAVAPPRAVQVSVGGEGTGRGATTTAGPTGVSTTVVASSQPLAVSVGVVVGGLPRARVARSVRVRAVRRLVLAGKRTRLKVRFPRGLVRQIRAALADGARVTARVTVTAVGAGGARARVVRRVRIRGALLRLRDRDRVRRAELRAGRGLVDRARLGAEHEHADARGAGEDLAVDARGDAHGVVGVERMPLAGDLDLAAAAQCQEHLLLPVSRVVVRRVVLEVRRHVDDRHPERRHAELRAHALERPAVRALHLVDALDREVRHEPASCRSVCEQSLKHTGCMSGGWRFGCGRGRAPQQLLDARGLDCGQRIAHGAGVDRVRTVHVAHSPIHRRAVPDVV
ncbi:MAG TPA: hypothetical protein VFS37_01720 [Conexibacter sp.]|nr:hypothetical protein [Conexibacter sp.]